MNATTAPSLVQPPRRSSLADAAAHHPLLAALVCVGSQFLLTIAILQTGRAVAPPEAFGKVKLVAFASTVLLPLLLAQVLGLWRDLGLELRKIKPSPVFVASLLAAALSLTMGVHPQEHSSFGSEVGFHFVNAFGEELLFRGVIFALLFRLPKWQAIAFSGITFGAMHLIHGFMDGNWHAALWQAALTSIPGLMFASVREATGSLWLTVLLHMVLNLCTIYSNVEFVGGPTALLVVHRLANGVELALTAYVITRGTRREALTA